jgi:ADP-dependent NAD(P)H-hydrate dehydratase
MKAPKPLTRAALADYPLPSMDSAEDKDSRGCVLAVAGSFRVPGAAWLAGVAALRAGAGKAQLALPKSIAAATGVSFPEAGIVPVDETPAGDGICTNDATFREALKKAHCVLVGPGLMDETGARDFAISCLAAQPSAFFVLDALALSKDVVNAPPVRAIAERIVLTPHHGEMATLLGIEKTAVAKSPLKYARQVAADIGCTVILKADTTYIVSGAEPGWRYDGGVVGLATSGSGDVLAGILAGLLARGAKPITAALWAVHAHAEAGRFLTKHMAPVGFLARELLDLIPSQLTKRTRSR